MPARKSEDVGTLRRGSACLSCRRRKLKCDGLRPVCQQCTKMRRTDECNYDDSKKKSRTQMLREKLAMLEEKVRELESDASGSNPSPSQFDSSRSPSVLNGSPPDDFLSIVSQPSQPLDVASWVDSNSTVSSYSSSPDVVASFWPDLGSSSSSSSPPGSENAAGSIRLGSPAVSFDKYSSLNQFSSTAYPDSTEPINWDPSSPLPYETHSFLLTTFMAHRSQCCFYSDMSRFDTIPHLRQPGDTPHPALMNAVYLLGCHFARSPLCTQLEDVFLTQTLQEITVSLHRSDQLVDVIQASTLLAVYYYFNDRVLEGYRHSFSAGRLAIGLGMHQIHPPDGVGSNGAWSTEIQDRITAFWQVFMVDRCWSAANGLLSALPDEKSPSLRITTPLPTRVDDLGLDISAFNSPIYTLFDPHSSGFQAASLAVPALKAIASAMYDRTSRLSNAFQRDAAFWADHNCCQNALDTFQALVPTFTGPDTWRPQGPYIDTDMFSVHTMIHVSAIYLQPDDDITLKTSWAANSILELIHQVHADDYQYLDPILSVCWASIAQTLSRRLKQYKNKPDNYYDTSNTIPFITHCVDILAASIKAVANFIPMSGDLARKVEENHHKCLLD